METNRRGFLRRFGIGAAGVGAAAVSGVTNAIGAAREHEAAVKVVEKIVEVPVPVAGGLVWAREPFGYGPLKLEEGEVFALTGLQNDHLLTGQGLARMIGKLGIVLCNCGRRFVFDNRGHNYMVDHCARTGHRPANLARPAVTVVDETRVGALVRRREVRLEVKTLHLDEEQAYREEQAYHVANRVIEAMKRPAVFPDAKLEERLREAAELPPIADLVAEPDPVILEVGGMLRPSLIERERRGT